ncbi:unnamed protein product [Meloidogyne enterolobii]|uniref:Uncharacterized protein n=1 Tax=Meloidogyne enterolobii TaxID=390850 RepID=A0ACB0ZR89_MELEN
MKILLKEFVFGFIYIWIVKVIKHRFYHQNNLNKFLVMWFNFLHQ